MQKININIDAPTMEDMEDFFNKKIADLKKSLDEKILTEKQACAFLQVTKPTLLKMRKNGRVKYFKAGNEIRYKKSNLLKIGK